MANNSTEDLSRRRIECPIWHSPLFYIVPTGLEVRCKSCRKAVHTIPRAKLEQLWDELGEHPSEIPVLLTESI